MQHRRTLSFSEKLRRHRHAVVTGIATLAVAGTATLAIALPQDAAPAEAAAHPVPANGLQPAADAASAQAAAEASASASASASAEAKAKADAEASASASASAEAEARAKAEASAEAEASAKAEASASASASASAKASAEAKARQEAASRSQQRQALPSSTPSASAFASTAASAPTYSGTPQQIAAQIVPAGQLQCFSNIVERESSWNVHATNPSSGAYGLMQALPGSKMASAGADWKDNPATQIKWGLQYMNETYGSPCAAWSFWQAHNWY
ncbi:lytic transglycosylase domain-containing protein [Kitasatospora sp. NPDC059646]|uniref:aggregation-promoting factor C-terminal-like domain-containing protein n=1 Tax=Kitasatospora sp. NPDC059646 TaxID=3346893 RepID=UPI003682702B